MLKGRTAYVKLELEALEKEQKQIDAEAAVLETKLRMVMETGEQNCGSFCATTPHIRPSFW